MKQQFRVLFKGPNLELDEQLNKRMLSQSTKSFFDPIQEFSCCWVLADIEKLTEWFFEEKSKLIWYENEETFNKFKVDNLKAFKRG